MLRRPAAPGSFSKHAGSFRDSKSIDIRNEINYLTKALAKEDQKNIPMWRIQ
jgi:hypothetical protein